MEVLQLVTEDPPLAFSFAPASIDSILDPSKLPPSLLSCPLARDTCDLISLMWMSELLRASGATL